MWNCTELDRVITDVHEFTRAGPAGTVVVVASLFLLGTLLLVAGERCARPLGAGAGGIGTAVVTYVCVAALPNVTCGARLVVATVGGVLAAALALFVLRTGIFLVAAGAAVLDVESDACASNYSKPSIESV